ALVRPNFETIASRRLRGHLCGDPFNTGFLASHMTEIDTVLQLVGTLKPAPWKEDQFRAIDRVSGLASIQAARQADAEHLVYVSVAHPAPIMKDYIAVRRECEAALYETALRATIVRPWYILGPGHWWPLLLKPGYWICEQLPSTRAAAARLGLVTISQMLRALIWAIENPPESIKILDVLAIRIIGNDPL
ncbi:MAG TPA: hypothetical protein VH681_04745, partial [Nitrospiraceae bacterium]